MAVALLLGGGWSEMIPGKYRKRSGSELVFSILKMLMVGYQLWGAESALELAQLSTSLQTTDARMGGVLAYLIGEGLVSLDKATGTVRLTGAGARDLLGHPRAEGLATTGVH
jgi:hypothetical protein